MNMFLKLTIMVILTLNIACVFGQKKNKTPKTANYEVKLKDGDSYVGKMLFSDKNGMQFLTTDGDTVLIDKQNIDSFKEYSEKKAFYEGIKSSDISRYFYTSPAFTIGEDQFAAATQGFSYSNITYGFTDRFSMEVGSSFTALLLQVPLVIITPKYQFVNSSKFKFSGYVSYMTTLPNSFDNNSSAFLFGITSTTGDELNNLSFGVSYGVLEGQFLDLPLFQLAAAKYVSPRTALIFDSQVVSFGQFLNDDIGFFYNAMPGIRLMRKDQSFDIAAAIFGFNINGEGDFFVFPYVGYNIHLSKL